MKQSNTLRTIGGLSAFAVAAGFAVTIGGGIASAAPGELTWSDGASTFTRTIDNATPTGDDTVTVTTKWARTDAHWERLHWAKDYHPTCLTYVAGSAKVTDAAGVHTIEPYVQTGADFTAVDFTTLGYEPTSKKGVDTPILSIQYKVGNDCDRGTALGTGMAYNGTRGAGTYTTKGPSITVAKSTSTTTLAPISGARVGQSVPLSAAVTGGADGDIVEFYDGATKLGQGALAAGKATFAWIPATDGVRSLTAKFVGTAKVAESVSAARNVLVAGESDVATTTVLNVPATATKDSAVNLAATVSPTPAGGTVQFMDGTTEIGTPIDVVDGKATLSHSFPTTGDRHITAVYSGAPGHVGSTAAAATITVTEAGGDTGSAGGSLGNIFGSLGNIFGS